MNYKIRSILLTGLMVVAATGCKKDFFDINNNPNDITSGSITSDLIIPAALHNAGALDAGGNSVGYDWLNVLAGGEHFNGWAGHIFLEVIQLIGDQELLLHSFHDGMIFGDDFDGVFGLVFVVRAGDPSS